MTPFGWTRIWCWRRWCSAGHRAGSRLPMRWCGRRHGQRQMRLFTRWMGGFLTRASRCCDRLLAARHRRSYFAVLGCWKGECAGGWKLGLGSRSRATRWSWGGASTALLSETAEREAGQDPSISRLPQAGLQLRLADGIGLVRGRRGGEGAANLMQFQDRSVAFDYRIVVSNLLLA